MLTYQQAIKACKKDLKGYSPAEIQTMLDKFGVRNANDLAQHLIDQHYPGQKGNMDPEESDDEFYWDRYDDALDEEDYDTLMELLDTANKDIIEIIYTGESCEHYQKIQKIGMDHPKIRPKFLVIHAISCKKFDDARELLENALLEITNDELDYIEDDIEGIENSIRNFDEGDIYNELEELNSIKNIIQTRKDQPPHDRDNQRGTSTELPYGGNIQRAMRAQDRDAISQIMAYNQANEAQRNVQLAEEQAQRVVPGHSRECSNAIDFATQEEWSDTVKPVVKIRYMNYDNPLKKIDQTICYAESPFQRAPELGIWIANKISNRGKPDSEGYGQEGSGGFGPSSQIVRKLPDSNFVIVNGNPQRGDFKAIPVGKVRLGNLEGSYGISELHGQAPDKTVYLLVKNEKKAIEKALKDHLTKMTLDRAKFIVRDSAEEIKKMRLGNIVRETRKMYEKIPAVDADYRNGHRDVPLPATRQLDL